MKVYGVPFLGAVVLFLVGCAAPVTAIHQVSHGEAAKEAELQLSMALKTEYEYRKRLNIVGSRILMASADQCADVVRPSMGVFVDTLESYDEKVRSVAARALNISNLHKVSAVVKNGPAEKAGIEVGDIILTTDIYQRRGESRADFAKRMPMGVPVDITVLRSDKKLNFSVAPVWVCDYPLHYANQDAVNAYADGKAIYITKGMLRFVKQDQELALVIGHELGHNTMKHGEKKRQNALLGSILDVALAVATKTTAQNSFAQAGAQAYSQDFEHEADYVGMYYLARAGYPTAGAADFWRRMAAENPANIKSNHAASHPATSERFVALEKTVTEINSKVTGQADLLPNQASTK